MIKNDVTLVLGAGASAHIKFPMGEALAKEILAATDDNAVLSRMAFQRGDFDLSEVAAFHNYFRESGTLSIDAFLEHRPDFLEIGKFAIAHSLTKCENLRELFTGGSTMCRQEKRQKL